MTDPRLAAATVLQGPQDLLGDQVVLVEPVSIDGLVVLVPTSAPGLAEYRTVVKAEASADELRASLVEALDRRGSIPVADDRLALEFRDFAGTAVASAAVGMESFANFHIRRVLAPDLERQEDEAGALREVRDKPLHVRYSDVLPELLDKPRPTDEPWWHDLRRIQGLAALQRHGLTEPRSRAGLPGRRSLNERLYGAEYRGASAVMLEVFEHFVPGWVSPETAAALRE